MAGEYGSGADTKKSLEHNGYGVIGSQDLHNSNPCSFVEVLTSL